MKKNYIPYIIGGILLLIVILYSLFFFFIKEEIKLKKSNFLLNEKIYLKDIIAKEKNVTIKDKNSLIDTSDTGINKLEIKYLNKFKKEKTANFKIKVEDKEKPKIIGPDKLSTEVGKKLEIKSLYEVKDNSKEKINLLVKGKVNYDKVGAYNIVLEAKDRSGNINTKSVMVTVYEGIIKTSKDFKDGTFATKNGFVIKIRNGVATVDDILIVNKTYSLPAGYATGLSMETKSAFNKMQKAAAKDNINLTIASGFRSNSRQQELYFNYVLRHGKDKADTFSARPGHSEHETGLTMDINLPDSKFNKTKEAKWLSDNAYKYGFILRYPEGKEAETGYMYESWHYRYVGEKLAKVLYNGGNWKTLEGYFGLTSRYE